MASLPSDFTIPEAGTYDYSSLNIGALYCLEFLQPEGGVFPESIQVQFAVGLDDAMVTPENGTFTDSNRASRFIAPTGGIRFVVSGDPTPVKVLLRQAKIKIN